MYLQVSSKWFHEILPFSSARRMTVSLEAESHLSAMRDYWPYPGALIPLGPVVPLVALANPTLLYKMATKLPVWPYFSGSL